MRIFVWLFRALVFFTLFAFALNNQHATTVHWFFGIEWQTPLVFALLAAFALGCALGVLAMLPGWWRRRPPVPREPEEAQRPAAPPSEPALSHPPRDGL